LGEHEFDTNDKRRAESWGGSHALDAMDSQKEEKKECSKRVDKVEPIRGKKNDKRRHRWSPLSDP